MSLFGERRIFRDRTHAGQILAAALRLRSDWTDALVVALARGGIPVGLQVAHELDLPLDFCVVRRITTAGDRAELIGAVASGGVRFLDDAVVARLGLTELEIAALSDREMLELERRERIYRGENSSDEVRASTVILVDDGIETGATMCAAVESVRARGARRLVIATPVSSYATCTRLARGVDALVCPVQPVEFTSVREWYENYSTVSDDQVRRCLDEACRVAEAGRGRTTWYVG